MKLSIIFLLYLISCLRAEDNDITKALKLHELIPDVIDEGAQEMLQIKYDSGAVVVPGEELTPTQVQNEPSLHWTAEADAFYTLIFTEPDAPSRASSSLREWQHWLVGNIPGNDISQGYEINGYQGSGPMKDTGLHRYVYLVYKQSKKLEFDEKLSPATSIEGRPNFSTRNFVRKYELGSPIAANFYQGQHDAYSDEILKKLGLL